MNAKINNLIDEHLIQFREKLVIYAERILVVEAESMSGCGLSDVLYNNQVQAAYANILAKAPNEDKAVVEAMLVKRGFVHNYIGYQAAEGECSLTGIDNDSCPCGRHG